MTKTTIIKDNNDTFKRNPVNSRHLSRTPTVHQDVEVPLRGGMAAAGFTFVCFLGVSLFREQIPTMSYVGLSVIVSAIIGFLFFIWRTIWMTSIIWNTEEVVGIDLNKDGYIGEPGHPVKININGNQSRENPTTVWRRKFESYVEFIYLKGTAHHLARQAFSENEINAFKQYAIDLGILKWKNPKNHNNGLEFVVDEIGAHEILERTEWVDIDRTQRIRK